ncbi:MAG: sulfur oxidation c-type cytochrome SoxX [Beijerinckiaceae bacterium]|nr:sulfur oxidation c-type cytochrome SoxX [Beijerinckiaceae bacterium]
MDRRCVAALLTLACCAPAAAASLQPYEITGDAIVAPLGGTRGDPAKGRAIVVDRQRGLCLLCHTGPFPEQRFQGDIAPSLAGAGSRLSEGQLRLRMVDSTRINPDSVMPSYYRTDHLTRVAPAQRDKPILEAQDIENVVAFLVTLRDQPSLKETR